MKNKWPKIIAPLSSEQKEISDDFMKYWHEILPGRYGLINKFNHEYAVNNAPSNFLRTLEIGAGDGEHLEYEKLSDDQHRNYYAVDIRENMLRSLKKRFPHVNAIQGDCQKRMDFDDGYFDRIVAIHVLEHLPNLPEAINEIYRICNKSSGEFSIVIPCEGSIAYILARKISSARIFKKRYKQDYKWFIEREHLNVPCEILNLISQKFDITKSEYFPIPIKYEFCNLCIGASFRPKKNL
jgi:ubiquinone/menaquinone biosynthesis C-methylase UbiE